MPAQQVFDASLHQVLPVDSLLLALSTGASPGFAQAVSDEGRCMMLLFLLELVRVVGFVARWN